MSKKKKSDFKDIGGRGSVSVTKELSVTEIFKEIAVNSMLSFLLFPVLFFVIVVGYYKLSEIAGGLYLEGFSLAIVMFVWQIYLCYTVYKRCDRFPVRVISWGELPLILFAVFSEYADLSILYFIFFEVIYQCTHSAKLKSRLSFLRIPDVNHLKINMCFFLCFVIAFVIGSLDINTYPKDYKYEPVSNAQGLILSLGLDAVPEEMLVDKGDIPSDKELISEQAAFDICAGYMCKETGCRSYSLESPGRVALIRDLNTEEYFYTLFITGKEYFGSRHAFGFMVNAETGAITTVEDQSGVFSN